MPTQNYFKFLTQKANNSKNSVLSIKLFMTWFLLISNNYLPTVIFLLVSSVEIIMG